jgi:transposase
MKQRKHYAPEEKAKILREAFLGKKPVSDICENHGIAPNVFYRWQQTFFENGKRAFESLTSKKRNKEIERIAYLEEKLRKKDEVLAELMEEHIKLKKNLGEI